MAQRICVTGAAGLAGRAVVRDLLEHGYEVAATDIAVSEADRFEGMLRADLTDYGQAIEALAGADAVVHLANIPAPGLATPAVTFNTNMTMNFNVFQAAASLRLSRVVWASSETTLGLPFDVPPRYAPVDEEHYPLATTTYALSKVATETIAGHFAADCRASSVRRAALLQHLEPAGLPRALCSGAPRPSCGSGICGAI